MINLNFFRVVSGSGLSNNQENDKCYVTTNATYNSSHESMNVTNGTTISEKDVKPSCEISFKNYSNYVENLKSRSHKQVNETANQTGNKLKCKQFFLLFIHIKIIIYLIKLIFYRIHYKSNIISQRNQ